MSDLEYIVRDLEDGQLGLDEARCREHAFQKRTDKASVTPSSLMPSRPETL